MKKSFNILLALVITFFTLPFGGITALADGEVYDDIKDGKYELNIKLLKKGTDEKSAAADFMNENATLTIENGKTELTFYIPSNPMMNFNKFEVEGIKPIDKEVDGLYHYTFSLNELRTNLSAIVSYEVPGIIKHDDVGMDIEIVGLNELPIKEEPTEAPEERVVGNLITESDADAVYKLEYETDSRATSGNLLNPVKLLEKDDKQYIQIPINEKGANYFRSLKINDKQVTWNSITEGPYTIQFELLGNIEDTLTVDMVIQAGTTVMPHDDIKVWFDTDTIEPIKEPAEESKPEQPQPAPEERVVGSLVKESEADAVYELEYETDSSATSRQLLNPVKLLEKNGKEYIQIPINEDGAKYFRSLEINGQQVIWNSITEGPYTIQFELPGNIEDTLTLDMVIQAGPNAMPHEDIKLWFDKDTLKEINSDTEKIEVEQGKKAPVKANDIISIKDSPGTQLVMPEDLPENTNVTIMPVPEKQMKNLKDLQVAGDVLEFDFEGLEGYEGTFELVMEYDTSKYDPNQVDIYYYDEIKGEWIAQEGQVKNGTITIKPTHFSTYGVFASELDSQDPVDPIDSLVPDKAYEIDFVIKHEKNDEPSLADGFFESRAILLEIDGERYLQITTTANSGQYIKSLRNKLGDKYEEMVIVEKTEDGRTIFQFKVNGELSDVILIDMIIDVAGIYENQHHNARIFLNEGSIDEVDPSNYQLVASTNPNGPNAPEGVTPVDPTPTPNPGPTPNPTPEQDPTPDRPDDFGDGSKGGTENGVKPENNNNPQTGDTTNILLYSILLIGSIIPLAVKLRRRFV